MTPMALDVMAAQLKYGVNQETRSGDDRYALAEVMNLNTWQCIWDAGETDTITGESLARPLSISLRSAEMNAMRPETGTPSERYDWGVANPWSDVLDTYLGLTSSRMGFMLGSGIFQAKKLSSYLKYIHANDQPAWQQIQANILEPLQNNLTKLASESFHYDDWSTALTSLAEGKLEDLPEVLAGQRSSARKASERRTISLAEKSADLFVSLHELYARIDDYVLSRPPKDFVAFVDRFAEGRSDQDDTMRRLAPGVAGHPSTDTPKLYRNYSNSGGFTIAAGVTIENAIGGQSDDEIIGNAANNQLYGRAGDDLIDGYLGNNLIDGGDGIDTAILFGAFSDYSFSGSATNLIATNQTRGFENTLISIEAVKIGDITYTPSELLAAVG